MANLGGKITLDISDLQAKIIQANKAIKSNESAWRESASQMDDWTKSEDALKSRLDVVNEKIKSQREIVAMLSEKKKLLIEQYGEESKQVEKVNADIIKYSKAIETSQKENESVKKSLEKLNAEQDAEKTAVNNATKAVKENTSATDKNAKEQKGLASAVSKAGEGFTVLKGVVANLTSTLITSTLSAVKKVTSSLMALPENTRALRKELAQVESAFESAGYSTDVAREAWLEYTSVLGDIDSSSTSTISLLASMTTKSKDLTTWINALTGVYAKLGKSYPTAELVKNIKETSNTGKMTENLKKVLQSAKVDTDEFAEKLANLNTEQERSAYILEVLNSEYSELGIALQTTNKDITEAEKAEKRLNLAWTTLGKAMEPVKTSIVNSVAAVVEAFGALVTGTGDVETLNYNIGYLAGTIARAFKDIYSMFEPTLKELKKNIVDWFENNKDDIKEKVVDWLKSIFGEDTIVRAKEWADKILSPIKTFFTQLSEGDYLGALGTALPVITIGVGLSLLQGAITAIPSAIITGLGSAFKSSGIVLGTLAGLAGVISLGLAVKETLEGKQTWADLGKNVVAGILAGLAFAGLTGSISGGVIVASLVLQTDAGKKAVDFVKEAVAESGGEGTVGTAIVNKIVEEKNKAEIDANLKNTANVEKAKASDTSVFRVADKRNTKTGLIDFEWTGTAEVKKQLNTELKKLINESFNVVGIIGEQLTNKNQLQYILNQASEGGKELAKAIADGYGIGIEDLSKITEIEAGQILLSMREVLGIHSPSTEAKKDGINFVQGWEDGLAGMPNATAKIAEEALGEVDEIVEEKTGFWGTLWKKTSETFNNLWSNIKQPFVEMGKYLKESFSSWEGFFNMIGDGFKTIKKGIEGVRDLMVTVLEGYDKEEGADSVYNTLYDSVVEKLKEAGGWGALIGVILEQVRNAMQSDENAEEYLQEVVDDIMEGFMQLLEDLPQIVKLALKFMLKLGRALVEAIPEIIAMLPEIIEEIITGFVEMIPEFVQLGIDLIAGLGEGIWEGIKGIGQLIYDAGSAVVGWFKDIFGINSPSRVMRDTIGKNIVAGIEEGIVDNVPMINSALDDVNTNLSLKVSKGNSGTEDKTKIINVYQNNNYSKSYSAYELYKSERAIRQLVGAY